MKFIYTILAILVLLSLISGLNYRLLSRILTPCHTKVVKYTYLFLTAATVLILGYGWPKHLSFGTSQYEIYHFFVYSAVAWFGGQLILLIFQPILYIAHKTFTKSKKTETQKPASMDAAMTRRGFLQSSLAVTSLLPFAISARAVYGAQSNLIVERHSLSISQLPSHLKGFKICQISDTHLGPYFDLEMLDDLITLVVQEKPDLVVITGDFIDDLELLRPALNKFNDLHSLIPHGIYYCLGNHEYFKNIELVRAELNQSRITVLTNQNALIVPGQQPFYLMGTDYPWADISRRGTVSISKRHDYFAAANQGMPLTAFKVLIAHHSDFLMDGFAAQIPLTLTGHTHGWQVIMGGQSLLPTSYKYMRGLYQENQVYGYVSSGAGHWFPFRLNCPREISVFILLT